MMSCYSNPYQYNFYNPYQQLQSRPVYMPSQQPYSYPASYRQNNNRPNNSLPQFSSIASQWPVSPDVFNRVSSAGKQYVMERLPVLVGTLPVIHELSRVWTEGAQAKRVLKQQPSIPRRNITPRQLTGDIAHGVSRFI